MIRSAEEIKERIAMYECERDRLRHGLSQAGDADTYEMLNRDLDVMTQRIAELMWVLGGDLSGVAIAP